MTSIFDVAVERSGLLNLVRDEKDNLAYLARRFGKTETEIRQMIEMIELQWFPAEVLWTSKETGTLQTCFPNDHSIERRFVFLLGRQQYPHAKFDQVEFEPRGTPCKDLVAGSKLVFSFKDKRLENMILHSKPCMDSTMLSQAMHHICWCYQSDYTQAAREAAACPRYRLITKHLHRGPLRADPTTRSWKATETWEEREQWQGCDLAKLQEHLQYNHFTKYDYPTYQQLISGQWVDCLCPLSAQVA